MALTKGFTCGYSGLVTLDEFFPNNLISSYISVSTTAGSIVFENSVGDLEYWPNAFVGYNPISARRILTSGVVDGEERTTTASVLGWGAGGNNP